MVKHWHLPADVCLSFCSSLTVCADGQRADRRGGLGPRWRHLWMWAVRPCGQSSGVDSERWTPAGQLQGPAGEDGHRPPANAETDVHRHEWRGGVHLWEDEEQSWAPGEGRSGFVFVFSLYFQFNFLWNKLQNKSKLLAFTFLHQNCVVIFFNSLNVYYVIWMNHHSIPKCTTRWQESTVYRSSGLRSYN